MRTRPSCTFGRRGLLALGLAALLAAPALFPAAAQSPQRLAVSNLVIATADGKRHAFKVELAATDDQRMVGLMYRRAMPADTGMLFDFERDAPVSMWMKNTFIPLDMLFIARDGRVVNIAERTVPHSLASISSAGPVRAVLEVNGGTAARLGLKPGDRVLHAMFGTAP